jgi:exonuclease SbcC
MRPLRLELEGFTAFRRRTEITFGDADLFVLCGPTGSGKSSVIDAMSFALYGSVPRYQDPKLVHPVISQGLLEARVRFDFAVHGRAHTVVRVVRRTGGGATTREARLESGGQVLAGSVRELNERIQALFGLTFEQFHTCVVLPQGEFARFLHETPANRQDLLKELLGLRDYERMGQAARQRAAQLKNELALQEQRLEDLAGATPAARGAAKARLRELRKLAKAADAAKVEVEAWETQRRELLAAAAAHAESFKRLAGLKPPRDLEQMGRDDASTRGALQEAERARARAEADLASAEEAWARLPDPQPLRDLAAALADRAAEAARLATAAEQEASLRRGLDEATALQKRAQDEESAARGRRDEVRHLHAACQLASGLSAGDPCPVCLRPVEKKPAHARPPALEQAERDLKAAESARAAADQAARKALSAHAQAAATVAGLTGRVAALDARVRGAPQPAEIDARLQSIAEAARRLTAARMELQRTQHAERAAREAHDRLSERIREAWTDFDRRRDELAAQRPPAPDRGNLAGAWKALLSWAEGVASVEAQKDGAARERAAALAQALRDRLAELAQACARIDLDTGKSDPRDAILRALTQTEQELERIEADLARRRELEAARQDSRARHATAQALSAHLAAAGFERWLLREAFDRLVEGASGRLRELTCGDYALRVSDQLSFEVIDHRNADEVRMVRTLSGGETFLASLALALTLADQVADLASGGAARLESIFLDEGFGALDPEALDTVAGAIEELATRGRTVGLVTHVRDLADRIPLQFRVSKGPNSSVVERVLQ